MGNVEDRTFLLLVAAVSLVFAWILWPLSGAILWGTLLAIVFVQPYRRLLKRMPQWRNVAVLLMLLIILLMVIFPLMLITTSLLQEASSLYESYQSGEFTFREYLTTIRNALPNGRLAC